MGEETEIPLLAYWDTNNTCNWVYGEAGYGHELYPYAGSWQKTKNEEPSDLTYMNILNPIWLMFKILKS